MVVVKLFIKIIQKEIEPAGWLARLDFAFDLWSSAFEKTKDPRPWTEQFLTLTLCS